MSKTLRSPAHTRILALLKEARDEAGLTQIELAELVGKPQSYIAKIEGGERRIDVVEFIMLMKALDADSSEVVRLVAGEVALPKPRPKSRVPRG